MTTEEPVIYHLLFFPEVQFSIRERSPMDSQERIRTCTWSDRTTQIGTYIIEFGDPPPAFARLRQPEVNQLPYAAGRNCIYGR